MKRSWRSQIGQAIVIIALAGTLMIAGVGLAVDVVVGYLYSVATERAAAAAALSGVVFMPDQFNSFSAVPAGSRNDAWDRAIDEAKRNGYDPQDVANGISVTPSRVTGHPNRLQVTVARNTPVFFMEIFGFRPYQVSKTAVATYLPPISLGEPGSQLGSSIGDLGRTRFLFMRTEGWGIDRGQGDAYTPNPAGSSDVHQMSYANQTEPWDGTLADRGGYDFRIVIPAGGPGGVIQVYNAAFAPDGWGAAANPCDNNNQVPANRTCSPGGNNFFHEDDGPFSYGTPSSFATMRYSLFRVSNIFIRSSDQLLAQLTVYPVDARNWRNASAQYLIRGGPTLGQTVTQQYSGGLPTNMLIYHNWVDVTSYSGTQDNGLVNLRTTSALSAYQAGGGLQAGTYRLRVDTLDNMGATFTSTSTSSHKGYALRAVKADVGQTACATCDVAGWNEICLFTPFAAGPGGSFSTSLFQLPPDYAGLTVTIDIWDVGDILSSTGFVRINILDPNGAVATSPHGIHIYDLGNQRSNLATGLYSTYPGTAGTTTASFVAQGPGVSADNRWVHVEIPIPSTYNPPPGQYWWSMQYQAGAGTVAIDTLTVAVGLKGGPVHLTS
jgi:hypothetical protein